MATIPQRYRSRQSPSPGQAAASYPTQRSRPLDLSSLQANLDQWAQRSLQRGEQEAKQAQKAAAVQAQQEAGAGELATPDEDIAPRFQDAFREQAIEFHSQQLEVDAQRELARLSREHQNDPEGFEQAAQSYADGLEESLRETDPTYAAMAKQGIVAQAQQQAQRLADKQFSRKQAARSQETIATIEEANAAFQQELLNSPDEERYQEAQEQIELRVERAQQAGLIDPSTASQILETNRRSLTREYVRGEFRKDLEAGDLDGARSIVESLRNGKWFRDNEQDRRLASQLAQEMESAAGNAQEDATSFALRRLEAKETVALEGGDPDLEDAEQWVKQVQRTGTPNQRAIAIERFNAAHVAKQLRPQIDQMSVPELEQARQELLGQVEKGQISTSAFNKLDTLIEDRKEQVQTLINEGRIAELGGQIDWTQKPGAIREQARERPRRAARVLASPTEEPEEYQARVEQIAANMPLFTPKELNQGVEQYRRAMKRGEHGRAAGILEALTGSYSNPTRMVGELSRAGEVSGELYAAGVLGQMGRAESADRLLYYADQGRSIQQDEDTRQTIENEVLEGDVKDLLNRQFADQIDSAAMGNAEMRTGLRSFLRDALYGWAAEVGEDGTVDAEEAVESWLGPLANKTEFANGSALPSAFLPQEGQDALVESVNQRIENASEPVDQGGLGLKNDTTDQDAIQPAPLGNGNMGFRLRGRWIMKGEGTGPVSVASPQPDPEEAETPEPRQGRGPGRDTGGEPMGFKEMFDAAASAASEFAERMQHSGEANEARKGAEAVGADPETMTAVVRAVQDVGEADSDKLHGREGFMGLPAEADDRVDWEQVRKRMQDAPTGLSGFERTVQNTNVAPYAAAQLMQQAKEAFPNDQRAQLTAYYEGEDVVEAAREAGGDQWFTELPHDTQAVVRRMERYLDGG